MNAPQPYSMLPVFRDPRFARPSTGGSIFIDSAEQMLRFPRYLNAPRVLPRSDAAPALAHPPG